MNADLKLAAACERALVVGARRERSATRQQLRAAARRFVRRHRRDAGYLGWVLRSVGASSALAVALLGLGAAPAHADIAPFAATQFPQPIDAGSYAAPALGDLDGDGDLDAIVGEYPGGTFGYYQNQQSPLIPFFVAVGGAGNPLNFFDVGIWAIPALADLDADGDLDLLSGESSGVFFYFRNDGDATNPLFFQQTGSANPMNGVDVGADSFPTFGDLDADGDLDLVVGDDTGAFRYFENTGNARTPAFAARTGSQNPLNGFDVGQVATPSLGDVDRDGDLDVVSGEALGAFRVFENTGSARTPVFVLRSGVADPLDGVSVTSLSSTSLGDLDADGDLDLFAGDRYGALVRFDNYAGNLVRRTGAGDLVGVGSVGAAFSAPALADLDGDADLDLATASSSAGLRYYRNTGSKTSPAYVEVTSGNPLSPITQGRTHPVFVDLDADGDSDLVTGRFDGTLEHWSNTGNAASPAFLEMVVPSFTNIDVGEAAAPAFGDLDDDGDLDMVLSGFQDQLFYYDNVGAPTAPIFFLRTGVGNPLLPVFLGTAGGSPILADVDGDDDLDLSIGSQDGAFAYFENTGDPANPAFVARFEAPNPLDDQTVDEFSTGAFGDLDGDGDLDLVAGAYDGVIRFFESFVRQRLVALEQTGAANPLNGQDVGALAAPALADLDRDGDPDLLAGEDLGTFRYFENTGTAVAPLYAARTGSANPLNGRDVGDEAKPAFGDLDGDGDFDVLAGSLAGHFWYFQNIGNARSPAFAGPTTNSFGLTPVAGSAAPVLADIDADGDLDLVAGQYYDALFWFRNTGSRTEPLFALVIDNDPFFQLSVEYYATPALADFDSDGDFDLVTGREHGRFDYAANGTFATFAIFEPRQVQPFQGEDAGDRAAPAAADLNGDGTPDVVTGNLAGTFAVHYLPEPAQGALLAAGVALLGWLKRQRGGRR